jgi:hypothetical protein
MDIHTTLLAARDFIKSANMMPDGLKFFLLLAVLLTFLGYYTLHQLPAILHEVPPTIRALREQPTKAPLENQIDSLEKLRV